MPGSLQKLEFSYAGILYLGSVGASHFLAARALSPEAAEADSAHSSREGRGEAAAAPGFGQGRSVRIARWVRAHGTGSPE